MQPVATPARTLALIRGKGLLPRKSRGQNFLIDNNIVKKIARAGHLEPGDTVVEIGPGLGALTQELAARAGCVIAIEIDKDLLSVLEEILAGNPNVCLVGADALKVNLDRLVAEVTGKKGGRLPAYKVMANLPYYITTPLLMHLLSSKFNISEMILMVQSEVGYRIKAVPGNKDYGALSVVVQYYTDPSIIFKVSRTVFYPQPMVDSLVIRLKMRETPPVEVVDEDFFFLVVRTAFSQRRKTLHNALGGLGLERTTLLKVLEDIKINPRSRAETLSIDEFARLSSALLHHWKRR